MFLAQIIELLNLTISLSSNTVTVQPIFFHCYSKISPLDGVIVKTESDGTTARFQMGRSRHKKRMGFPVLNGFNHGSPFFCH